MEFLFRSNKMAAIIIQLYATFKPCENEGFQTILRERLLIA